MRKLNKLTSIIIALTMIISMFSTITVSAASFDGLSLSYTFEDSSVKGVADGTVVISGITSELQADITNVNIYWGKSSTEALDGYYNLKYYTVLGYYKEDGTTKDGVAANSKNTKLQYVNDSLTYVLSGNMAIPNEATHLIAEVIGTTGGTKLLSVEIPAEKRLNLTSDDLEYAMIWGSDIHLKKESALSDSRARKAVQSAVRISDLYGDKFKGMILNGDIADTAKEYEYDMAEQFFRDYGVDFPIYYSNGNHDTIMFSNGVNQYDECEKAMQYRFDKLESDFGITFDSADFWSYETTVGDHHYIFFASPHKDLGVNLTEARKAWLEEKICYYEKSGEPTFIFTHYPYTGKLSRDTAGFTFDDILERHPSVTVITSHVHMELNSDFITTNISTDGGNNFLDTASMSYTNNLNSVTRYVPESRVIEVYDDVIILKSIDNSNDTWIPRGEHILNVNGTNNPFDGTFTVSSSADKGVMAEGTVLTAKLNGADIPEGYTVTWYDMAGTELGTGSTYTVVNPDASVSAKMVKTEDSSYAYAVARYIAPVEDDGTTDEGDDETDIPTIEFDGNAQVLFYNNILNISGTVDTSYAGKDATFVLIPKATYTDLSTAEYINDCTIGEDGSYKFKFKTDAENLDDDYVLLLKVDSATVTKNEVVPRTTEVLIQFTAEYDKETGKVNISVVNDFLDETQLQAVMASYLGDERFSAMTVNPFKLEFGENEEVQNTAIAVENPGSFIKAMLWKDITGMTPVAGAQRMEVPAQTTEDVVEE